VVSITQCCRHACVGEVSSVCHVFFSATLPWNHGYWCQAGYAHKTDSRKSNINCKAIELPIVHPNMQEVRARDHVWSCLIARADRFVDYTARTIQLQEPIGDAIEGKVGMIGTCSIELYHVQGRGECGLLLVFHFHCRFPRLFFLISLLR
jgi:hypothetical protein